MSNITGESFERAEHLVRVLFESGEWPTTALEHFGVDEKAWSQFVEHQNGRLRKLYPDIDPRHEAAIATMMTHLLFVGIACGRAEGYSTDSGLNT